MFCTLVLGLGLANAKLAAQACIGTGTVNVTVQDCTHTSTPLESALNIYPNPAQASFWVKTGAEPVFIELFDGLGLKRMEQALGGNTSLEIRTEHLPSGLYWVHWRTRTQLGTKYVLVTAN